MTPTDWIASSQSPELYSLSLPTSYGNDRSDANIYCTPGATPISIIHEDHEETAQLNDSSSATTNFDHDDEQLTQITSASQKSFHRTIRMNPSNTRRSTIQSDKSPPYPTLVAPRLSRLHYKDADVRDFYESGFSGRNSGALRSGLPPSLFSKEMLGLFSQYAAVGIVYGALPGMIYPLMQNYLNVEGVQTVAARSLLTLPWSFKAFYGILTDCFPIFGYRRRPYIAIGWSICIAMLFCMAWIPLGQPYYTDVSVRHVKPSSYTREQAATLNPSASMLEGKYTGMMMLATFGYLLGDVAADAVVVEYAQREPEVTRGRTQSAVYAVRNLFMMLANLFTGFCLNGKDYGGDFTFSLTFPQVMFLLGVLVLPVIPITYCCIVEEQVEAPMFAKYMHQLWNVLQQGVVYQVVGYKFFATLFENFTSVALDPIQQYWAKATPMMEKVANIAAIALMAATFSITGRYGLHWNWRRTTFIAVIMMLVLDAVSVFCTTWNIVRNQWFWLGIPVLETIPRGINFILSMYVVVELVKVGQEGAIYGLLSTVSNLAEPFAKTISKNLNAPFNIDNDSIQNDSIELRLSVTKTLILMYSARILSLFFLPLLPAQKRETQELRLRRDLDSPMMGFLTISYLVAAFVYTIVANTLSIIPYTSCTILAGGSGCDS
uniref:FolateBiopterin Transporter (FBT) Family putative n=1 Tax=Albugo laibachii Nc14 TaxID=890382 RepID=F0WM22_9STRA|nr:FolateBiopterin Transporter (FBT) Family putative [Albugo laibachii Nc14]|eukprot:CCA22349.1 FolateBiopterin Transporter (FBT) Family putative [Albugo laibachii Nc14]